MSRPKPIYTPGTASKMGRPFNDVPTEKVVGLVQPETVRLIKAIQKKHGCTVGQAIDRLATHWPTDTETATRR